MTPYLLLITATTNTTENTTQNNPIIDFFIEKLPGYLLAVVLIGIAFLIAKIITSMVQKKFSEEALVDTPQNIVILAKRITFTTVFLLGVLISLAATGLLGNLGWLFGSLGLAIGLSLQGITSHFIAGILIILQKKTSIGNYVRMKEVEGTIIEVGTRATTIQTLDGVEILVPNKNFIDNEVIIYTSNPYRRLTVEIGIDYNTDIGTVSSLILGHLKEHKDIIHDAPKEVLVSNFGDSSVDLQVRFWVPSRSEWWTIQSTITKEIKELFDAHHIEMPYPHQVIHIMQEYPKPLTQHQ